MRILSRTLFPWQMEGRGIITLYVITKQIVSGALPERCPERLFAISKAACLGTEGRCSVSSAHGRCVPS